ncbi:hypothetical protein JCM8097_003526 [Rhodosporidiobolus ruineniae]
MSAALLVQNGVHPPRRPFGPSTTLEDALAGLDLSAAPPPALNGSSHLNGAATALNGTSKPAPWMDKLDRRLDVAGKRTGVELLDEEIESFCRWTRPTRAEHLFRQQVFECFKRLVEKFWPGAKVELFGSMVTGLYLPHGDFDVVITHETLERIPTHTVLSSLRTALQRSRFTSSIQLIESARVPLVKFTTSPQFGSFRFDVSFNGPLGPKGAVESIRLLAEVEKRREGGKARVKRLVMILKALLDAKGLNEVKNGGLGGLSTFCLVISYVQLVEWSKPPCPAQDLQRFLNYYGFGFEYRQWCITTSKGGAVMYKNSCSWSEKQQNERLSIQHPVNPQRDLSSGSHAIRNIRDALEDAAETVNNVFDPSGPPMLDSTLFACGIRFSHKVLQQREGNRMLADSGSGEQMAKNWVPPVEEDPILARTRTNGHISPRNGYFSPSNFPASGTPASPSSASTLSPLLTPSPYPLLLHPQPAQQGFPPYPSYPQPGSSTPNYGSSPAFTPPLLSPTSQPSTPSYPPSYLPSSLSNGYLRAQSSANYSTAQPSPHYAVAPGSYDPWPVTSGATSPFAGSTPSSAPATDPPSSRSPRSPRRRGVKTK